MFYCYTQNNSYGSLVIDDKVTQHVIIEAPNADTANALAENVGLYFDGDGDCPCCGNRWAPSACDEGDETPLIYSESVKDYKTWNFEGKPFAYIYYLDGRKEAFR